MCLNMLFDVLSAVPIRRCLSFISGLLLSVSLLVVIQPIARHSIKWLCADISNNG